ncbi:hypothetical protein ACFOZ1_06960 [Gracilibacillus marinus]|jgi:hypothetical protein|uniref:YneQ n=1 Tax=Gracilibacillus marinus TaxID=630535 RepID=A0ABV8VUG0_9BACI
MAFGITREILSQWKQKVRNEEIAFLTHYWIDDRFPNCNTVTKVGCSNLEKLSEWGKKYHLQKEWIHMDDQFPHFDLFGETQRAILKNEFQLDQLKRLEAE